MDRLDAMETLVAVVAAGSFSAASRRLGVPLATVSRKVAALEAKLGTRLLTRSTRRLAPTDAGATYIAAARRILDQIDEAERGAAGEYSAPQGELVVTAPVVFGRLHVLPELAAFLGMHPRIDARLVLSDRNLHLTDDHIDVAVRIGALPDSTLVATRVGSVRNVVCASPAYLKAHGVPRSPDDLAALDCVIFEALGPAASWSFGGPSGGPKSVHARLSVNTAEAAIDAAIAGVGLTRVLSYQAADAVARGALKIVLASHEPEALPVNLVQIGKALAPLKTRRFIEFIAPRLRERLRQLDAALAAASSIG